MGTTGQPFVLVVEDDSEVAFVVQTCLVQAGYRAQVVRSGRDALEAIPADPPDAIVSDVMMPVMDGLELCRRLRADPGTASIPILLLTARSDLDSEQDGYAAGADDFLAKPFSPRELRRRTGRLLAAHA